MTREFFESGPWQFETGREKPQDWPAKDIRAELKFEISPAPAKGKRRTGFRREEN